MAEKVNLAEKLATFDDRWSPRIVADYNDSKVMVVKAEGDFTWHSHEDTDDLFLVLAGHLTIELRDGDVELGPGELFVVPKGVEHRPRAHGVAQVLLMEPHGTPNTGSAGGELTAPELRA
jgi:mannose-6-phosphate isomerase-like protein (cupin superfamily)